MLLTKLWVTRPTVLFPNNKHHSPSDPDDKGQFRLRWHIVVSHFASSAGQTDFTSVHLPVLLVVLLSPLVDQFPDHFAGLKTQY